MRANERKLLGFVREIRAHGTSEQLLKDVIVTLADEVIYLSRELDSVRSQAQRADRNARTFGGVRVR